MDDNTIPPNKSQQEKPKNTLQNQSNTSVISLATPPPKKPDPKAFIPVPEEHRLITFGTFLRFLDQTRSQKNGYHNKDNRKLDVPIANTLADQHLLGKVKVGAYLTKKTSEYTCVVALDIDNHEEADEFSTQEALQQIVEAFHAKQLRPLISISPGGLGFHLWLKFNIYQQRSLVRTVMGTILAEAGFTPLTKGSRDDYKFNKDSKIKVEVRGANNKALTLPFFNQRLGVCPDSYIHIYPKQAFENWGFSLSLDGMTDEEYEDLINSGDSTDQEYYQDTGEDIDERQDTARLALLSLPTDADTKYHDTWFKIMASFHYAYSGSDKGKNIFNHWCSGFGKDYNPKEVNDRWKTLSSNKSNRLTEYWLYKLADEIGDKEKWTGIRPKRKEPDLSIYEMKNASMKPPQVTQLLDKDGNNLVKLSLRNAKLILSLDGKYNLAKDLFMDSHIYKDTGLQYRDSHVYRIQEYIHGSYNLDFSIQRMEQAIKGVFDSNAFDPVIEYFDSLEWDGQERLSTWLEDHAGVVKSPVLKHYLEQVSRKILMSIVARGLASDSNAVKVDHMVILEGAQGVGKSRLVEALSPNEFWFNDSVNFRDSDKALAEKMSGSLIVEFQEIAGMVGRSARGVEDLKAFITRKADKYRGAYKQYAYANVRRCVFFGTTNDSKYLIDRSGARRFWPIQIGQINIEELRENLDQLYAEAKHAYLVNKENLYLDDDGEKQARSVQEDKRVITEVELNTTKILQKILTANADYQDEDYLKWRERKKAGGERPYLKSEKLGEWVYSELIDQKSTSINSVYKQMPNLMRKSGWEKNKIRIDGIQSQWWYPSDSLWDSVHCSQGDIDEDEEELIIDGFEIN